LCSLGRGKNEGLFRCIGRPLCSNCCWVDLHYHYLGSHRLCSTDAAASVTISRFGTIATKAYLVFLYPWFPDSKFGFLIIRDEDFVTVCLAVRFMWRPVLNIATWGLEGLPISELPILAHFAHVTGLRFSSGRFKGQWFDWGIYPCSNTQ